MKIPQVIYKIKTESRGVAHVVKSLRWSVRLSNVFIKAIEYFAVLLFYFASRPCLSNSLSVLVMILK